MTVEVILHFSSAERPELERVYFTGFGEEKRLSVRAKVSGPVRYANVFQWSPAVQAAAMLFCRHACWKAAGQPPQLSGEAATPASSLDYAISKMPNWLVDMFGYDRDGNPYARQLFLRVNPERKRPGPVTISIRDDLLPNFSVKVFVKEQHCTATEEIAALLQTIEQDWVSPIAAGRSFRPEGLPVASPQPEPKTVSDEYMRLWSSRGAVRDKIAATKQLLGNLSTHALLCLDWQSDVICKNAEGDAQVSLTLDVANISDSTVVGEQHDVYFDPPRGPDNFLLTMEDEDGNALNFSMQRDYGNYKQFYCTFARPLPPLEHYRYTYTYETRGLFVKGASANSHYWDLRVRRLTNHMRHHLTHKKEKTYKGCFVVRESFGGYVVHNPTTLEVDYDDKQVIIDWTQDFPSFGECYRLYWEFHP